VIFKEALGVALTGYFILNTSQISILASDI
jgi:hypothetical protein